MTSFFDLVYRYPLQVVLSLDCVKTWMLVWINSLVINSYSIS